jgi:flagellar assembly factor FliW
MSSLDPSPIAVESSRFGSFSVDASAVIEFPQGVIGFSEFRRYVMLEHKPPFCWLQSVEDPGLAFVVIDGIGLGERYDLRVPFSDKSCEFRESDEFAILLIVTVRSDPKLTSANLKAPLFVNMRTRKAVQVIYDDPELSTRHPLFELG